MQQPTKRRHTGTWILVIFALLELCAIVGLVAFRTNACAIAGFVPLGGAMRVGGGGADDTNGSPGPLPTPTAVPPASTAPAPGSSAAGSGGDFKTAGDTNQVPDPNCVGKTAAGLLNSSPAPAATASCAPMSPPPALKSAEDQVQSGSVTAPSSP